MKRSGPCRHCGVTCSPMWRKGPLEKAVLCNACGTRFRHRGHLNNYLPKQCKPHYYLNKLPDLSLKIWGKPLTNVANSVWGEEPLTNVENSSEGGRKGAGLWKYRIPTRKRSPRVCKRMFSMQRFQKQLLDEWVRQGKPMNDSSSEDVLLFNNVNNFIPTNEIGVGVMLLKLDGPSI